MDTGREPADYGSLKPRTGFDLNLLTLTENPRMEPLFATVYSEGYPSISPDGRWLAYVTDESGRSEVYVRPFPGPGGAGSDLPRRRLGTDMEPERSRDFLSTARP